MLRTQRSKTDDAVKEQERVFADPSLPLAVVVASTRWDETPRMRHHVTRQLMRWFNVLFVEFFPTDRPEAERRLLRGVAARLVVYTPPSCVSISSHLYANDPFTHKAVNVYFSKVIMNVVRKICVGKPVLFNFVYHYPEIMAETLFAYRAYVCYDEFPRMQRRAHKRNPLLAWYQAKLFQHYEDQVARRADRCFTPHYPLQRKLMRVNPNVDMLFHAHDLKVIPACKPRRERGTIRVGYFGYINWRLCPRWLLAVLQEKDMLLHLMGPLERSVYFSELQKYSSFKYAGPVSLEEFVEKARNIDVWIMPYDPAITEVSILTTNSKTFQYIATCKPVVISNLPHYIRLPYGVIYKAEDEMDFVSLVRKAYREDSVEYVSLRSRIAAENTWDKRGEELFETLKRDVLSLGRLGEVGL